MADNYLENKYEQLRSGRPVIRRVNPSLDTLLTRIADATPSHGSSPSDRIRQAQLEAIVRSAAMLGSGCRFEISEEDGRIQVFGPSSPRVSIISAGETVLAMRLKAAELGFACQVTVTKESAVAASLLLASLYFYR